MIRRFGAWLSGRSEVIPPLPGDEIYDASILDGRRTIFVSSPSVPFPLQEDGPRTPEEREKGSIAIETEIESWQSHNIDEIIEASIRQADDEWRIIRDLYISSQKRNRGVRD